MLHLYKFDDKNIVLDVDSGAIYLVDEICFDILTSLKAEGISKIDEKPNTNILSTVLKKYEEEKVLQAYHELYELYKEGQLFFTADYNFVVENDKIPTVKVICLNISHDCNLRCEYCFAEEGSDFSKKELMPFEIAKKAIDFLIEKSGKRRNLEVDFFGGEPLMNFEVVKQTVDYCRSIEKKYNKNFKFSITTNGVLLDKEITDFINKEMEIVVLSLDGRKEINDSMRKTVNGKGSYDLIVDKFKSLVEERGKKTYYVRGTYTKKNKKFLKDVLHLVDLGFKETSLMPAVFSGESDLRFKDEDLNDILLEYENLAKEMASRKNTGNSFNFYDFSLDFDKLPCTVKRLKGCGSGTEYVTVVPDGKIYPCHQLAGEKAYMMGNVLDGKIDENIRQKFSNSNIYHKPKCKECWAKFYCCGGCNANNIKLNNDLNKPDDFLCALKKKKIECAIYLKALEV